MCNGGCDNADGDADGEPFSFSFQAHPEGAAMGGGYGSVAFLGQRRGPDFFVGQVFLRGGAQQRGGAAILKSS